MKFEDKKKKLENDIFKDVINKKVALNVSTYSICSDLDLEEEMVSSYFLGNCKENMILGLEILRYLEHKESN